MDNSITVSSRISQSAVKSRFSPPRYGSMEIISLWFGHNTPLPFIVSLAAYELWPSRSRSLSSVGLLMQILLSIKELN